MLLFSEIIPAVVMLPTALRIPQPLPSVNHSSPPAEMMPLGCDPAVGSGYSVKGEAAGVGAGVDLAAAILVAAPPMALAADGVPGSVPIPCPPHAASAEATAVKAASWAIRESDRIKKTPMSKEKMPGSGMVSCDHPGPDSYRISSARTALSKSLPLVNAG